MAAQPNRSAAALALRKEGKTYREIAREIGCADDPSRPISIKRAKELVTRQERRKEFLRDSGDLAPLGFMVCRVLRQCGVRSLADLAGSDADRFMLEGARRRSNSAYFVNGNMLGRKSLEKIDDLLSLHGLPLLARRARHCPPRLTAAEERVVENARAALSPGMDQLVAIIDRLTTELSMSQRHTATPEVSPDSPAKHPEAADFMSQRQL